jgi:hypothetical protein
MIATYAATAAICVASLAIGQAAIALCGARRWSWLSPAVGLALLCAICWGTVRLPGDGALSAIAVTLATVAALAYLWQRLEGDGGELRTGAAVAALALLAASLPFAVEGHFGILGTGFNPDMSQHLLASDQLAAGQASQLLSQGYPLGPHAIVVALDKGLGIGLVQGFDGLSVAVAVLGSLTVLNALSSPPAWRRVGGALVVGLAYLVASYYAQGSFKETMQAIFVLAFVLALRESTGAWGDLPLRFVPAALIAVGSVYTYSYPGLLWLVAAAAVWAALSRGSTGTATRRPALLALLLFVVLGAPEAGRMVEFHNFETFDPNGPGLGNLFGQISPFEALGIWPSGDFRLAPGDGAAPALLYYMGAAFGSLLLIYGLVLCRRRRETAIVAGVIAAVAIYVVSRVAGTPYTTAKAIEVGAPVVALAIVLPLWRRPAALLFMLAAGGCSLLALANAPVGPTSYSPALTGLRPLLGTAPTLVLASDRLLDEEHGERYIVWELRGGRVCVGREAEAGGKPPAGVRFIVTEGGFAGGGDGGRGGGDAGREGGAGAPFAGLRVRKDAPPYVLWETARPPHGHSDCPLIAVRQARQGPASE